MPHSFYLDIIFIAAFGIYLAFVARWLEQKKGNIKNLKDSPLRLQIVRKARILVFVEGALRLPLLLFTIWRMQAVWTEAGLWMPTSWVITLIFSFLACRLLFTRSYYSAVLFMASSEGL